MKKNTLLREKNMDVVVDLNVLRGDKFKGDNYIIPLLLIIELLDSDSINYDRKMKLLEKIKNREYEIDKRHPRTFFCEAIGEKNRDQDVYDIFIENLLNSSFTNIVGFKELIEYNKLTAIKFDNSFVQHDFSKLINKDLYRGKIKENPEIETKLKLAVIKRIKKLLVENFKSSNQIESFLMTDSLDVYFSIMAYYQFSAAINGHPKKNDFTDINYMLYLTSGRKFYTLDNKINIALRIMRPDLIA
ncbi:MAG: hypothetical protein SPH83_03000 [Treponema sp.]|uniref:hypothetical protein n=1 Tax=Treponema sp. TaxID=166 RepID=UPI002579E23C|nr:hypothetical protein [Treponema sp.]MDY6189448.1 hypothetical protein [Treponema sp.]